MYPEHTRIRRRLVLGKYAAKHLPAEMGRQEQRVENAVGFCEI